MIWSIAWRNIWRTPRRSVILIAAMALGMFAGVFSMTFYRGWMDQRMEAGIETEVSCLQVHQPGFLDNWDMNLFIPDGIKASEKIEEIQNVDGISPRIVIQSMISSAETSSGIRVDGIIPEKEKTATNLWSFVSEGTYFGNNTRNPAVIGKKLASILKVKLNSRIVITLQDLEGNIVNAAFRVCGIFDTENNGFEEMQVYVKYNDLRRLTGLPEGSAHEIAIHLKNKKELPEGKEIIGSKFPELEILTWKEINPELGMLADYGNVYIYMFLVIILLALGFGIVNTMLMAVLERIKELGMLMAVGMSKPRVFKMLMLETVLLTLTGGLAGIGAGVVATLATAKSGINLSMWAQGLQDLGYASLVYPTLEAPMVGMVAGMVILTGIIASLYPAGKALSYPPAEALRIDM